MQSPDHRKATYQLQYSYSIYLHLRGLQIIFSRFHIIEYVIGGSIVLFSKSDKQFLLNKAEQ